MENCPFCLENNVIKGSILLKNDHCYMVESIDPVLSAAGMIIPHRHVENPFDLNETEWQGIKKLLSEARTLFDTQYAPDGYNVGWNIGEVAGQNEAHVHLHIIARFKDEPLVGKGIRYAFKQESNKRTGGK